MISILTAGDVSLEENRRPLLLSNFQFFDLSLAGPRRRKIPLGNHFPNPHLQRPVLIRELLSIFPKKPCRRQRAAFFKKYFTDSPKR
jgi:hypothetical protein